MVPFLAKRRDFNLAIFCAVFVPLLLFFHVEKAFAVSYMLMTVSDLTEQDKIDSLIKTIATGADHRDFRPAVSMGTHFGFDIGAEVMSIKVPVLFSETLAASTLDLMTNNIQLARLHIQKGLPYRLDFALSYFNYSSSNVELKLLGGDLKWTISKARRGLPISALKISMNDASLGFIHSRIYKLDYLVSKSFFMIDPYIGTGVQVWSGALNLTASQLRRLPAGVNAFSSGIAMHAYAGFMLKLAFSQAASDTDQSKGGTIVRFMFSRIGAEADFSSTGTINYGAKLSLGF